VLVHIDASDGTLAHADAGSSIPSDEAAEKLEEVGIVADEHHVLPVGIFVDQLLKVRVARAKVKRRADFDFALVAEFVADELGGLERTLQRAGDDDVGLDFEGAEKPAHEHALLFAFGDKAALRVELCALTRNTGVRVAHEVEIHSGGRA